ASRERIEIDENQRPLTLAVNEIDARSDRRRKLTLNAEGRSVDVRLHTAGIVDRWIEIQLHARLLGDRAQQITQPSECGDVVRFDEIDEVLPVRACVGDAHAEAIREPRRVQKKLRPEQQLRLVVETTKAAADDRACRLAR